MQGHPRQKRHGEKLIQAHDLQQSFALGEICNEEAARCGSTPKPNQAPPKPILRTINVRRQQGQIQDFGQGAQWRFDPRGALSLKFAQNRGFSLKIA